MNHKLIDLTGWDEINQPVDKWCYEIKFPNGDTRYFTREPKRHVSGVITDIPSKWSASIRIASDVPENKRREIIQWWWDNMSQSYKDKMNKRYQVALANNFKLKESAEAVLNWMLRKPMSVKSPGQTLNNLLRKNIDVFMKKIK